jgi:hypothetical protein
MSRWQTAHKKKPGVGLGMLHINQKVEPRDRYQLNLRSEATGKTIFTSVERTF